MIDYKNYIGCEVDVEVQNDLLRGKLIDVIGDKELIIAPNDTDDLTAYIREIKSFYAEKPFSRLTPWELHEIGKRELEKEHQVKVSENDDFWVEVKTCENEPYAVAVLQRGDLVQRYVLDIDDWFGMTELYEKEEK